MYLITSHNMIIAQHHGRSTDEMSILRNPWLHNCKLDTVKGTIVHFCGSANMLPYLFFVSSARKEDHRFYKFGYDPARI